MLFTTLICILMLILIKETVQKYFSSGQEPTSPLIEQLQGVIEASTHEVEALNQEVEQLRTLKKAADERAYAHLKVEQERGLDVEEAKEARIVAEEAVPDRNSLVTATHSLLRVVSAFLFLSLTGAVTVCVDSPYILLDKW